MSRKRAARWVCNLILAGCLVGGGYTAAQLMHPPTSPAHGPSHTHETPAKTVDVSPRFVKA